MSYHDQYYQPGVSSLSPELLNQALAQVGELAGQLATGDTSSLPEDVYHVLDLHGQAINTESMAAARQTVADAMGESPYTGEDARRVGEVLLRFADFSSAAAQQLLDFDRHYADMFRSLL